MPISKTPESPTSSLKLVEHKCRRVDPTTVIYYFIIGAYSGQGRFLLDKLSDVVVFGTEDLVNLPKKTPFVVKLFSVCNSAEKVSGNMFL